MLPLKQNCCYLCVQAFYILTTPENINIRGNFTRNSLDGFWFIVHQSRFLFMIQKILLSPISSIKLKGGKPEYYIHSQYSKSGTLSWLKVLCSLLFAGDQSQWYGTWDAAFLLTSKSTCLNIIFGRKIGIAPRGSPTKFCNISQISFTKNYYVNVIVHS